MSTKILLADDHTIMREGLEALLTIEPDLKVVAHAADGRQAVRLTDQLKPDIVVTDVEMPGLNGIEATRRITARHPKTKVIALTAHTRQAMITNMLEAGCKGYVAKRAGFAQLCKGIKTVLTGEVFLCAHTTSQLFDTGGMPVLSPERNVLRMLTGREREVLQLVAEGQGTKDIARTLYISPKTVESHRQHLMEKLGIHNVAGLTKYAIREGFTPA